MLKEKMLLQIIAVVELFQNIAVLFLLLMATAAASAARCAAGCRHSGFNPCMHSTVEIIHLSKALNVEQVGHFCASLTMAAYNDQWGLLRQLVDRIKNI